MSDSVIIVGSGVGGATLAKELTSKGTDVSVLEAGAYPKIGTERNALNFYTGNMLGPGEFSKNNVEILRTKMVGGSSVVTIGNGVRALQNEFKTAGIDLEEWFKEAEHELKITLCPESKRGERTNLISKASEELGYECKSMPKFIDFSKCAGCGNCNLGCVSGAKWTSRNYIGEAFKHGLKLKTNHEVVEVLHKGQEVIGVKVRTQDGVETIASDKVVLAAGGIGTPIILQNSGIEAGSNLFADVLIDTFGVLNGASFKTELDMAIIIDEFHDSEGYILSPYMEGPLDILTDRIPLIQRMNARNTRKMIGIMTKIKDLPNGNVNADGSILKPIVEVDQMKLDKGFEKSKLILDTIGVKSNDIFKSHLRAAHPGGTARVGQVVNRELETEISGLYVCDCSTFPDSPGMPPVLTIVALSKYLGNKFFE